MLSIRTFGLTVGSISLAETPRQSLLGGDEMNGIGIAITVFAVITVIFLSITWTRTRRAAWALPIAAIAVLWANQYGPIDIEPWQLYTFWTLFIMATIIVFMTKEYTKTFRTIIMAILVLVAIIYFSVFVIITPKETIDTTKSTTETTAEPTPTTSPTPTVAPTKPDAMDMAKKLLEESGWKPDEYELVEVDPSKDGSTTGDAGFTDTNIKNAKEMVAFLKSDKKGAPALYNWIIEETGDTRGDVLNEANWVAVQPNVPFVYPNNTGFINGLVVDVGERDGSSGDIFMLYISKSGSGVPVRGACANPQKDMPTPPTPTPTPTKPPAPTPTPTPKPTPSLAPKDPSKDPAPQGNAPEGGGLNEDPGPGEYIAPSDMVQPPAETRVDPPKPTYVGLAPEASPTPAPSVGVSPTPSPAPEIGANPTPTIGPEPESGTDPTTVETQPANPGGDPGYPTGDGW